MGIIPAYAGNTRGSTPSVLSRRDHPRVCGDHSQGFDTGCLTLGSSPRMRGTPNLAKTADRQLGIIPAYAGNTRKSVFKFDSTRDHPRVCGEHDAGRINQATFTGSSPRMRGTLGTALNHFLNRGIIPAYAGNTIAVCNAFQISPDHPRVCGEHAG